MALRVSLITVPQKEPRNIDAEIELLKRQLRTNGSIPAQVFGESMLPLVREGQLVTVYPLEIGRLKRFDVVVFWSGQRWIIHYVWHFNEIPGASGERVFITRGLNVRGEDSPVAESKILGIAKEIEIPIRYRLREVICRLLSRWLPLLAPKRGF